MLTFLHLLQRGIKALQIHADLATAVPSPLSFFLHAGSMDKHMHIVLPAELLLATWQLLSSLFSIYNLDTIHAATYASAADRNFIKVRSPSLHNGCGDA
jgi:hypothetical protein